MTEKACSTCTVQIQSEGLRYIARLRYAIKYKLGRATFDQMEYGVASYATDI
ncbi:MAG: hypothetical protein ACLS6O_02405 [Bifidobacterium sp.]